MLPSKYILARNNYVIKRVNENESYKAPRASMDFRKNLLEPIVDAEVSSKSGTPKPPGYLVRGKSVYDTSRMLYNSKSDKPKVIMRTGSKLSCGVNCVDGTMTWIANKDLIDYVYTMTDVSIGKINQNIKLFDMKNGINKDLIINNPQVIDCIHRILSNNYSTKNENNLIPFNNCEILSIYRKYLRKLGITKKSDEGDEFDMLLSMIFGSDRLTLSDQQLVLSNFQDEMLDYVKSNFSVDDFNARQLLWSVNGDELWSGKWSNFTKKFGFSVSDGNITPFRLIEEWNKSISELSKVSNVTKSQRCSIYSCDLIASLILCIISEVNGYDMYGYKYSPRNTFRLKDEQDEFCLNAYAIQNMIDWTNDFKCNTFIDDLSSKYNNSELDTLHDKNSKSGKKSKASKNSKSGKKSKASKKSKSGKNSKSGKKEKF